jgi:hypothetical protein
MPCVRYKAPHRKSWREMILITTEKTGKVIYDGVFDLEDEKLLKMINKYCPGYFKKISIIEIEK